MMLVGDTNVGMGYGFINTWRAITPNHCPRTFLDIIGRDPSVSKSNMYMLTSSGFLDYSLDSSKMIGDFYEVFNFNWLFVNSTSSCETKVNMIFSVIWYFMSLS